MRELLLVTGASAIGAPARYLLDRFVQVRHERVLPWGTLTVNLTGALLLGVLVGASRHHHVSPEVSTVIGTGFLGAYTTFSTFTWETMRLVEEGALAMATLNVAGSVVGGLAAASTGLGLAHLIW